MLQELISRWVGSTTGTDQWDTLIDAVVMCDEPAVAQELATAVGCPLPLSGTTTDIDINEIKLDVPFRIKHCRIFFMHSVWAVMVQNTLVVL